MGKLTALWRRLTGSLWFLPGITVAMCAILAVCLIWIDRVNRFGLAETYPLIFGGGVEGSRGVLSAIASSVVTVAGVVFSITIVALSLASSQYSPRVLRTFMADRPTQLVLGSFVGIFTYCILVLRTIGEASASDPFVPTIAVLTGIGLALIGVGLLVYFIHHVATSIQASSILERVADETVQVIDAIYPDPLDGVEHRDPRASEDTTGWRAVCALRTGYVQGIDFAKLAQVAKEHELMLRIETGVGKFVIEGEVLLRASHGAREALDEALRGPLALGAQRSSAQDVAFGIQQIVDVALKGLSPGINDTTTALMCIDRLGVVLRRLAGRRMLPRLEAPELERIVLTQVADFEGMLACAFDAIRRNASGNPDVLFRLIHNTDALLALTSSPARRRLIRRHVSATLECAGRTVAAQREREAVVDAANRSLAAFDLSLGSASMASSSKDEPREAAQS